MSLNRVSRVGKFTQTLLITSLFACTSAFADVELDTKFGTVSVPDHAQRVVTLYEGALDSAIAVGSKPVGTITTRGLTGVAPYIQDKAGDIEIVGTSRETNLEAVIALQPDLILASSRLSKEQYALLSSVAPTVVPGFDSMSEDGWHKEARLFAKALGKSDTMDNTLAALDKRTHALKAQLESASSDAPEVIIARWMPNGAMVMSPLIFSGQLLTDVGFNVADGGVIKEGRPHSAPLSLENLSTVDKDWLFLATLNEDGQSALEAAKKSPAFERLDVVKEKRVVPVNGQLWSSTSGPIAAGVILDQLESLVQRTQP